MYVQASPGSYKKVSLEGEGGEETRVPQQLRPSLAYPLGGAFSNLAESEDQLRTQQCSFDVREATVRGGRNVFL